MYTPNGDINDKLLELMKDKEFVEKFAASTPETAYSLVKEYAPEVSEDEFKASAKVMVGYLEESQDGVLSEDELDQVAGGSKSGAKSFFQDFGTGFKIGWSGTLDIMKAIVGQ